MTETDGGPEWNIPLVAHYKEGLFRSDDPALIAIEWWGGPDVRKFRRDFHATFKLPSGEPCAYYREVSA